MPIYEYVCQRLECGHRFERIVQKPDKTPKCPKCKYSTEQAFSAPARRNPDYGIQR